LLHEHDYVPLDRDAAIDTEPLLEAAMYLASSGRLDGSGDPLHECATERWIVASPGTLCHAMTMGACQAAGFTPRVRHHADDFVTVLALAAAGRILVRFRG
jgi:DNA-binding transcriptional LysR family regulator